jgi:hypothetical protein
MREKPTPDAYGGTYLVAFEMAKSFGLTFRQFYGLLHAAVFRSDAQVADWDEREVGGSSGK